MPRKLHVFDPASGETRQVSSQGFYFFDLEALPGAGAAYLATDFIFDPTTNFFEVWVSRGAENRKVFEFFTPSDGDETFNFLHVLGDQLLIDAWSLVTHADELWVYEPGPRPPTGSPPSWRTTELLDRNWLVAGGLIFSRRSPPRAAKSCGSATAPPTAPSGS